MIDYKKVEMLPLSEFIFEYKETNTENNYRPVAVGKYGIRTRESIYSKELAKDYSKNKLIYKDTLTVGMGSNQIDIGILIDDAIYSVSPAYHTYKIKGINSSYLDYCLKCRNMDMFNQFVKRGSRQGKSIDLKRWLTYKIPVYDTETQLEIIHRLEKSLKLVELRKQQLQQLDELIKARFVELFGDVKTNSFGWEKCRFGDVATKITDGEHGTVPRVEKGEGYLYFMARNITKDGNIDLTETSYVPEEVHRKIYKRCNPETGDILLVCVGATIGKCTIVPKDFEEFSMARSVALIKPDSQKVNSTFLISLLKSDAIQNDISNCAHAAAQAGLYTNMIISLDAFLPPIELQNQFATFVEQVDKSKFVVQKALDEAQTLFDSLMQEYFG